MGMLGAEAGVTTLTLALCVTVTLSGVLTADTHAHHYTHTAVTQVGMVVRETRTSRSVTDCSRYCLKSYWSAYFTFDPVTRHCACARNLDPGLTPPTPSAGAFYAHRALSQCPVDLPSDNFNIYLYKNTVVCIKFYTSPTRNYDAAASVCAQASNTLTGASGRLVKANSLDVLTILAEADDAEGTLSTNNVWVGLGDRASEGTYVYTDGETADNAVLMPLFSPGEPSDTGPQNEDCVNFLRRDHWLNDAACFLPYPFICEVPLVDV